MISEVRPGYFVSNRCKGCTARDRAGNPLRDMLDLKKEKGESTISLVSFLRENGWFVAQPNLDKHFRDHSAWIARKRTELSYAKQETVLARQEMEHRDAEEEIQKLIDIGGDRIDRGEIQVDKELYMFGINHKTKNSSPLSIQNLVMNFGHAVSEYEGKGFKSDNLRIPEIEVVGDG